MLLVRLICGGPLNRGWSNAPRKLSERSLWRYPLYEADCVLGTDRSECPNDRVGSSSFCAVHHHLSHRLHAYAAVLARSHALVVRR